MKLGFPLEPVLRDRSLSPPRAASRSGIPYSSMNKFVLLSVVLAVSGLNGITVPETRAETPASAASNAQNDEPLHVIIDYPDGKKKVRESHHGLIDRIALPLSQEVTITLQFQNKRAGAPLLISSLDGGDLILPQSTSVPSQGDFSFQFRAGNLPGVFRLLINSLQQYQVSLYAYDPSHPPGHGRNGAGH